MSTAPNGDGGRNWSWLHWAFSAGWTTVMAGVGYAIAYGFKNAWPLIVCVGAGVFVVGKRGRRLKMSRGWTAAYITTAALLGGLLSMPTWLLTWVYACAHNDCPFS